MPTLYHREVNFCMSEIMSIFESLLSREQSVSMSKESSHQDTSAPSSSLPSEEKSTYQLELPPELSDVHDVFHVSQLRKCLQVPNKPNLYKDIDHRAINLQPRSDLSRKRPDSHLWTKHRVSYSKPCNIKYFKVQGSNHTEG